MKNMSYKEYKDQLINKLGKENAIELKRTTNLTWKHLVEMYSNEATIEVKNASNIEREWKKVLNKQSFQGNKEKFITPISNSIPFRSPMKIKSLYPNISSDELKLVKKYNNYKQTKQHQLKTLSKSQHVYMGDIFFTRNNKSAFLILINVNTRYVYAQQLGFTYVEKYIDVDLQNEHIKLKYNTKNRKSVQVIKKAFEIILQQTKIKGITFDGEPTIRSQEFNEFLKEHQIIINDHTTMVRTSLNLIDRFCRTIRDMSFTSNREILTQEDMDEIIRMYNYCRHEGLTRAITKANIIIRNKMDKL